MNELIIIRGASGSGKTTLAQDMIKNGRADIIFEADQYFVRPDGHYDFNAKLLKNAHDWCHRNVERELSHPSLGMAPKVVIVSNTFTRLWEMSGYIKMCVEKKIPFRVIRCEGKFQNVHGVPEEKVQEMRDRFEDFEGETVVNNE